MFLTSAPGFSDGPCRRHLLLRVRRCLRIGITVADRRKLARIQIRGFWKIRPTRSKTHRGCMLMDTCFGECRVGGCCLCGRHLNRRYLCGCRLRWCCACCFGSIGGLRCGTWGCCIRHRSACMSFDGFVAKYTGDGVLVYFGYPQAQEDDAERAVRAALELIEAVGGLKCSAPLQTCVGIATGLVVVGDLIGTG